MEHSPYCIPITQTLRALEVAFDTVAIPNWDRSKLIQLTEGAYYQVPILQHGERLIFESSDQSLDVAKYVDEQFGDGRLFPEETAGIQEVLVQHIENEVEGLTFKLCDIHYLPAIEDLVGRVVSVRHKERRFGRGCVDSWRENAESLRGELEAKLELYDRTLQYRDYLMGEEPQYVDFALFGVIGNYTYRGYNELAEAHQGLRKWYERMRLFRYRNEE